MNKRRSWQQSTYNPPRALTIKNIILNMLCNELGMSGQRRVAGFLANQLFEAIDACYRSMKTVRPGQLVLLLPCAGFGAGYQRSFESAHQAG